MSSYKTFFKGKRILVVGLGAECEAVADIIFLIKAGAIVSMVDMRNEARILPAIKKIQAAGMVACTFGSMSRTLVENQDLVLKSTDISDNVPCIREAFDRDIPVELSVTLFLKLAPPITLIGVLGICAKASTASLISKTLGIIFNTKNEQSLWYVDKNSNQSPMSFLRKIKKGDIVLVCISEDHYSLYSKARISPHVAVITTPLTAFDILKHQTYNNFLIANDTIVDTIREEGIVTKAKILRTGLGILPSTWNLEQIPRHMKENIALAVRVAELFKVVPEDIQNCIESFKPLKGRLEWVKKIEGIDFYNDAMSTSPYATVTALQTVGNEKNIILIVGGAKTHYDQYELFKIIPQYVSKIIFIPGSGTMRLHKIFSQGIYTYSIEEALTLAYQCARKGDKILFSPAFPPMTSMKERMEKCVKAIKKISPHK